VGSEWDRRLVDLGPGGTHIMTAQSGKVGEFVRGVDYYELLGVGRDASAAEIKSAYRSLARTMHPDVGGTSGTFRMLQEAYETLNDPDRRAHYDGEVSAGESGAGKAGAGKSGAGKSGAGKAGAGVAEPSAPRQRSGPVWRWGGPRTDRPRDFGEDPDFVPRPPRLAPDDIPWWETVDPVQRVRHIPATGPEPGPVLAALGAWLLLLLVGLLVPLPLVPMILWFLMVLASGIVVLVLLRRAIAAQRVDRLFKAEFRGRMVFGRTDPDERAKHATAAMLERYLTRLPGARIFHGLSWPDSVFADIDHAVLCGRRLVLIESKAWLPGHYTADEEGTLWRNGHVFRGGATRLPEGLAVYRDLLPDIEVRGVLLIYPSRAGEVTTVGRTDTPISPLTPAQFVRELGGWLAADSATVDRDVFRTVLRRVVSR
jgi:hypothetical protein